MEPGSIVLTTTIKHNKYDEKGTQEVQISYAPNHRDECFVLLALGVMKKTDDPKALALRVLEEIGWMPQPDHVLD